MIDGIAPLYLLQQILQLIRNIFSLFNIDSLLNL